MHLDALPPADFDVEPDTSPTPDLSSAIAARREIEAVVDRDGFDRDTGTRIGEARLLPETEASSGLNWAVQVASFERRESAIARRDILLADGYEAFLSSAKRDGRVMTRVAVGPLVDREDAIRLKAELDDRYPDEAVVVRFGP